MGTIAAGPPAAGAITGSGGRGRPPGRRGRRAARCLAWTLAAAAAFTVYLRLARTRAVNSDGAAQALQAWDLLHGNLLLHGWTLTDVSFYTTEIPEYLLIEVARGLGQDVVHVAAAVTYTLAVVLAALLAKGTATGRPGLVRAALAAGIMLAPQLNAGTNVLLSSPDHTGTSVPVLLAWLTLERWELERWETAASGRRPRWPVPAAVFAVLVALLAWSMVADELVLVIGVVPLIAVCAVRAVRGALAARRAGSPDPGAPESAGTRIWLAVRFEAALALAGAAAAVLAIGTLRVLRAAGGFAGPPVSSQLAPLHTIIGHNLPVTADGLLLLGGAYFPGLPAGAPAWLGVAHVAGLVLVAAGVALAARSFLRGTGDRVSALLLAGIVIDLAAYAAGTHASILPNTREIAPVLPFAAVLAGRQLGSRLPTARPGARRITAGALGLVLSCYVAGLGLELTAPCAPPQDARLAAWLAAHPIGTGLSGYWESNVVTLTSGGRTVLRPVSVTGGRIVPLSHNSAAQWFDPRTARADFIVSGPAFRGHPGDPPYAGFGGGTAAIATFGRPWRVYHVGGFTILRYHRNLLAAMNRGSAAVRGDRGSGAVRGDRGSGGVRNAGR